MQRFRSYVPAGVLLSLFVVALATLGAVGPSTASGDTSNAFALQIGPCEEGSKARFVAGEILVQMMPGADIGPILEEEGEPPGAAELVFADILEEAELVFDEVFDWYIVSVPEGEELAKCRAYSAHPEVLAVEPNFLGTPDNPSPTPYPQSTITVRFVGDLAGTFPLLVHLDRPIAKLTADGVDCTPESVAGDVTVREFSLLWPMSGAGLPQECYQAPPTTLCFEFLRYISLEPIVVEAVWEGGDLELLKPLLGIADRAGPSPTTLPTCPGPESLPSGGGPPGGSSTPAVILIIAGVVLLVISAAVAFSQRQGRNKT